MSHMYLSYIITLFNLISAANNTNLRSLYTQHLKACGAVETMILMRLPCIHRLDEVRT